MILRVGMVIVYYYFVKLARCGTILLAKLRSQILGFDNICELNIHDPFFATMYHDCLTKSQGGFYLSNGYLFKEGRLCIPLGSHRKLLIKEMHEGGLMGHFGMRGDLWVPLS